MESADKERLLEGSLLLFCNFVLTVIFIGGLASNLLVLLVFYRKPGLRTTANRFVINLTIINIVSCLSLLPIAFANNTTLAVENYFCFSERFSSIFCSSAIIYAILLIAIDQYFAVVNPLHYHCIISSWKGYLMIVATWGLSIGLALLGAIQPDIGIRERNFSGRCRIYGYLISSYDKGSFLEEEGGDIKISTVESSANFHQVIFGVTFATTSFLVPFGLICFIYYSICVAASGNNKRTRSSILTNDDHVSAMGNKYQNESDHPSTTSTSDAKQSEPSSSTALEFSETSQTNGNESNPSFLLTRSSPPKPPSRIKGFEGDSCREMESETETANATPENTSNVATDNNLKVKIESEAPLLKPTLKNSSSFTKLSSLHIQFSSSTEKMLEKSQGDRRHSNILLGTLDPEFDNLDKSKSSSMQSSFYVSNSSRSSGSTRSATISTQIQSSRSSSLNSGNYARLPPSRASSIRSTSSYIVHSIRHRISNASFFRYREEARAARISAMVIVMVLFCWLPFFTVFSFFHSAVCLGQISRFPYYLDAFAIVFLLSSTIASPFLFAFRNRQIKKEIRKIFQFCPGRRWACCSESFYANNFSMTLKSQSVQLLTDAGKKENPRQISPLKAKSLV